MNENLNLVEILKDCQKGTKLYSSVFGSVELDHIDISANYPIVIRLKDLDVHECLTTEGTLFTEYEGECILFPSREQRDWSKFNPKKEGFITPCEFKDGDIVATNSGLQVFILQMPKSDLQGHCHVGYDFETNEFFFSRERFDRLATEEEKQRLFDAIKLNGYKWNAETKTLEKLVKPMFDPKTLMAFDKVLVRYNNTDYWRCDFFSHELDGEGVYKYACIKSVYKRCIPYNDDTKHLLGTSDEAPEYYRYWED